MRYFPSDTVSSDSQTCMLMPVPAHCTAHHGVSERKVNIKWKHLLSLLLGLSFSLLKKNQFLIDLVIDFSPSFCLVPFSSCNRLVWRYTVDTKTKTDGVCHVSFRPSSQIIKQTWQCPVCGSIWKPNSPYMAVARGTQNPIWQWTLRAFVLGAQGPLPDFRTGGDHTGHTYQ